MFQIEFAKGVDRESIALSAHPGFMEIIARSRAEFRRGETISLEEMKAAFEETGSRSPHLKPAKRALKTLKSR